MPDNSPPSVPEAAPGPVSEAAPGPVPSAPSGSGSAPSLPAGDGGGITSMDPAALASVGSDLHEAARAVEGGLAVYESVPMETLAVVLGPIGGEFLAAFDAATTRHRELLHHAARCVDAAGTLCVTCAQAYGRLDAWHAGSLAAAGGTAGVVEV